LDGGKWPVIEEIKSESTNSSYVDSRYVAAIKLMSDLKQALAMPQAAEKISLIRQY
jgi:hypothetical protein